MSSIPLCVDLDGTLIRIDVFRAALFSLLKKNPLLVVFIAPYLLWGRARFKQQIAKLSPIEPKKLLYHPDVLALITKARQEGRRTVLATGADIAPANHIAEHLGVFDEVIASDGERNLTGTAKARELCERYGTGAFDYIGNSRIDLHVWKHARRAFVVTEDQQLIRELSSISGVAHQLTWSK